MNAIFLDVDGVLNNAKTKAKCWGYVGIDNALVRKLGQIVKMTDARIILTSTWKDEFIPGSIVQKDHMAKYLMNKLLRAGLWVTDKTIDKWYNRGEGIMDYLTMHPEITQWVVIDDQLFTDFYDYIDIIKRLVTTDPALGLTDADVKEAIQILQ